jgi:pimeloyl-ACP methyl ester carboxylesterase
MGKGKFIYKEQASMDKMLGFYDKAMASLDVEYREEYIDTSFGKTHVIIAGDETKPAIFTVHGGNGTTPLNLKLFLPLIKDYCLITPDVIGMPGKSAPYRTLDTSKDDFGMWLVESLDALKIDKIPFVVSSYSAAMFLSLAQVAPERIDKAALVVPSGIAHGPLIPIARRMTVPMTKYYFVQSDRSFKKIMDLMASEDDEQMDEFFKLMMSSYKMEMKPPREFKKEELSGFRAPVMVFASDEDIFFPAYRVFPAAKALFNVSPELCKISGNHLPSAQTMSFVCVRINEFFDSDN